MKIRLSAILMLVLLLSSAIPVSAADDIVEKTFCTQGIAYESIDKLKLDLLNNAKKAVINELFGEFIVASTAVENFVVTKDQIQTSSIGFVRVEGNTDFHNGDDFADVCVTLRAYITDEDKAKFNPEKIGKKYCDADDNLTTAQLIAYVKEEAILQALVEYDPKLKGADSESLIQLVQKVTYRGNGFITDTQTYCATFDGYVVPVEIMAFLGSDDSSSTLATKQERITQWASQIHSFSSQYNDTGWSAEQVLGEPNITNCGDHAGSWTTSASGTQFVEVGFEKAIYPEKLIVRENNQVGFVSRLEFFTTDGNSELIEVTDQLTDCPGESEFDLSGIIDFPTNRVKVYINADHGGYEEIDAIALQGFTTVISNNTDAREASHDQFEFDDKTLPLTWKGVADQTGYGQFEMILHIEDIDSDKFTGKLHWPTLRNSITYMEGKFVNDFGDILEQSKWRYVDENFKTLSGRWLSFTETKMIQGSNIELNGTYLAYVANDGSMRGVWFRNSQAEPELKFDLAIEAAR